MSTLPLATSKQFRKVARSILKQKGIYVHWSYTDPVKSDPKKRYCSYWIPWHRYSDKDVVKQIEFALWGQGVTANTRVTGSSLRGTCILEK